MVPHVLLGDQNISCAGCRAPECPVPGHPCLGNTVVPIEVVAAVDRLDRATPRRSDHAAVRPDRPASATPVKARST